MITGRTVLFFSCVKSGSGTHSMCSGVNWLRRESDHSSAPNTKLRKSRVLKYPIGVHGLRLRFLFL